MPCVRAILRAKTEIARPGLIATISIVDETGQICLDGLFWATLSGYSRSFRREEE